jgi:protein-disulfide isomerase
MRYKTMKMLSLFAVLAAVAVAWLGFPVQSGRAEASRSEIETIVRDYLASHPDEVGAIAKDYLLRNPDILRDVLAEWVKRRKQNVAAATGAALDRKAAIAAHASTLFASPRQITLGDPAGDVTLVEFFDYSCGFCKRALPDLLRLLKEDSRLKVVLKDLPILGPGSTEAARIAVAVRMQDPDGSKYLGFHQKLLGAPGPASKEKALAAAAEQGLDMDRLTIDAASDEVRATLEENMRLARELGVNGTPVYVVGDTVISGAVGANLLMQKIADARRSAAN